MKQQNIMKTKLARITEISKERPKEIFTSIYHFMNKELLIEKSFLVIIGIVLIGNFCELTSVVVIDLCSSIIASLILFNRFFRVEEREE